MSYPTDWGFIDELVDERDLLRPEDYGLDEDEDSTDVQWGLGDFSDVEWDRHQEETQTRLKQRREWEAGLKKLARDEARAEARQARENR
ncbi:hypothetical protein HYV70_01675 [Candidatus Uhrbacteria bacterium]|nr:hypothetical protein [Candidatus Uhrbacteria bacterium]